MSWLLYILPDLSSTKDAFDGVSITSQFSLGGSIGSSITSDLTLK